VEKIAERERRSSWKSGGGADKVTGSCELIDDLGADSSTPSSSSWRSRRSSAARSDDAAETILTVGDAVKFLEKNAKS